MCYMLTLTLSERKAFDWVGDRYFCGNDATDILCECLAPDDETEWDDDAEITFYIPEHKAWELQETFEKDTEGGHSMFPCFSSDLREKLYKFLDQIV